MFGLTTMYLTELHSLLESKMLTNALNSVAGSVLCYLVGPLGAKRSQEFWLGATGTGGIWSPASRNAVQKPLLGSIRNCLMHSSVCAFLLPHRGLHFQTPGSGVTPFWQTDSGLRLGPAKAQL